MKRENCQCDVLQHLRELHAAMDRAVLEADSWDDVAGQLRRDFHPEGDKASARRAKIKKRVTPHTLRHSYATGLLEAGVDILTISRLLGHSSFLTTMIYLHVRRPHLNSTPSPLDWLPVRQLPNWQQPKQQNNEQQGEDRD